MIGALGWGAYRGVMGAAAGAAGLAARLPGAPAPWRAMRDRLGALEAPDRAMAAGGAAIWLHAASVGELIAARPLLTRLRERFPERLYVVSTLTRSGLDLARELPEVHLPLLFPLDAPRTVRTVLAPFRLEAFLFTETEIWPTFLSELARTGVPAFMVSGRVGPGTIRWARWLRPVYRRALAGVTCCMQSEEDAARVVALGADPHWVQVAGSLKFDVAPAPPPPEVTRLGAALGSRRLIVAGSTHAGEDEALLAAYARVLRRHPDVLLLLAPRHVERAPAVAAAVEAAGLRLVRWADAVAPEGGAALDPPAVVLLDAVGPLAHCYALGAVAFVGGSLVPAGGHNVLEPARAARPIVVGPHTEHSADVVDRLVAGGAALRVASAEELAAVLEGLVDEPARAAQMGQRARVLVESGQGALDRHLKIIAARLSGARFARAAG